MFHWLEAAVQEPAESQLFASYVALASLMLQLQCSDALSAFGHALMLSGTALALAVLVCVGNLVCSLNCVRVPESVALRQ